MWLQTEKFWDREEYGTMRMQKKGTKLSQGGSDFSVSSEGWLGLNYNFHRGLRKGKYGEQQASWNEHGQFG